MPHGTPSGRVAFAWSAWTVDGRRRCAEAIVGASAIRDRRERHTAGLWANADPAPPDGSRKRTTTWRALFVTKQHGMCESQRGPAGHATPGRIRDKHGGPDCRIGLWACKMQFTPVFDSDRLTAYSGKLRHGSYTSTPVNAGF